MSKKKMSYQEAVDKVETIVARIEQEAPDMDELSALVREAMELLKYCKGKLKATEEDLEKAMRDLE